MSKGAKTESFRMQGEIFALTDPKATISVSVSNEGVTPDENGRKIVLAGTIVGGIGGQVMKDQNLMVAKHGPASLTTALAGDNNDLIFIAVGAGTISVAYTDPSAMSAPLVASVSGTDVTVQLGTDASGAIISTANDVMAAVNDTPAVAAVVRAKNIPGEPGTGVVTVMEKTTLISNTSVAQAEGVLVNDVDVTDGPEPAAMAILGFIEITRIPVPPTAAQEGTMKLLQFINYKN